VINANILIILMLLTTLQMKYKIIYKWKDN